MKSVEECCAGINVGKLRLNVCVLTGPADQDPQVKLREFMTLQCGTGQAAKWLLETGCTQAVMESTGSHGYPVYDLTRRRRQRIGDSVSERNRVQKVLEEANIKLGSVLSDVFGVSGQTDAGETAEG